MVQEKNVRRKANDRNPHHEIAAMRRQCLSHDLAIRATEKPLPDAFRNCFIQCGILQGNCMRTG